MTNWWRFVADWDESVTSNIGLYGPLPSTSGVDEGTQSGSMPTFTLGRPWPNPSRESVSVLLNVGRPADLEVAVFDVLGRQVRELVAGSFGEGTSLVEWDGRDSSGDRAAAGIYFVRARAGLSLASQRIVIAR